MNRTWMKPLLLTGGMLVGLGLLGADGKKAGCVPVPVTIECAGPSDCEGMTHDACEGAWTCTDDAMCAWECAPPPPDCVVGPVCGGSGGFAVAPFPADCPQGSTCQCVPSCPACDDCPAAACMPTFGAWLCPGDGACGDGASCQCIPSCPDCADCALSACVPADLCAPIDCPLWAPPAPGWCDGGVVLDGGKDANGCQLPPKCVKDCAAAETLHGALVAEAKACTVGAECTQPVPVGLLCQCPAVLNTGADVASIEAIQTWYMKACAPSDGWGCGGGCPDLPLGTCTQGTCGF